MRLRKPDLAIAIGQQAAEHATRAQIGGMRYHRPTRTLRPLTDDHWQEPTPDHMRGISHLGRGDTTAWFHRTEPIVILSSYYPSIEPPDGQGDPIPQWHLSIASRAADNIGDHTIAIRPSAWAIQHLVDTFGLESYEIDNHHPGMAQHLWVPLDPDRRTECGCKATETVVVDPDDGYAWTNPVDGPCRGCEHALSFPDRACPLHQ